MSASFQQKLKSLPVSPGVYFMKDQLGQIIYVGKAKNIRNRVRSYFVNAAQHDLKTKKLVSAIADFEIMITGTEVEALLAERTLIGLHKPHYNVLLRDDKQYPYVRIDFREEWPRLEKVRKRKKDQARYLGPYSKAGHLHVLLKAIQRIFPLIKCSRHEFANAKRPCNYYQMKMCVAPCSLEVERAEYLKMIQSAVALLEGRNREVARNLETAMQQAAEVENYELAAQLRDQLVAVENLNEKQSVVVQDIHDADLIHYAAENELMCIHLLNVRQGKLVGGEGFSLDISTASEQDGLRSFLLLYYENQVCPDELVVPFLPEDHLELATLFSDHSAHKKANRTTVRIKEAKSRTRQDLMKMARENAQYSLAELSRTKKKIATELSVVQEKLGLKKLPQRIECMDISNLHGTAITASCVCFINGTPAKHEYRTYSIRTVEGHADDFASIEEAVRRRLSREDVEDSLPDLLVIDGGRGQLQAALKASREFPHLNLSIVGLAKSRVEKKPGYTEPNNRSYERVFLPGVEQPVILPPGSSECRLLTHIRDEAHRFALLHHRKKRQKIAIKSELDDIPGVGPKTKKLLMEHFRSIAGIKQASLDSLNALKGLPESTAVAIHSHFKGEQDPFSD